MNSVYPASAPHLTSLLSLAAIFGRDANSTLGGGSATAETLRRELVTRRAWVSDGDFRLAYAASRLTPATNLLALCVALGWHLRSYAGALVALLASSIPSAFVVAVMAATYSGVESYAGMVDAMRGAIAVSVALLLSSAWSLAGPQVRVRTLRTLVLILSCWIAYSLLQFSALAVLAIAGVVGFVWSDGATP